MTGKIFVTRDAKPGWWRADGRGLLEYTKTIPSVTSTETGIVVADAFAGEVRDALAAAGYEIIVGEPYQPPDTPHPSRHVPGHDHRRYVSDADELVILPDNAPGGHWQDESATCSQCHPSPARTAEHQALIAEISADLKRALRAHEARDLRSQDEERSRLRRDSSTKNDEEQSEDA